MTYDVIMVVGRESNAEANWARLSARIPGAIRVGGAESIRAAYSKAAEVARTSHFFVVDGDNWLVDGFGFELDIRPEPGEVVFLWARNPVNGLEYAHGAIKLLPTVRTRHLTSMPAPVDLTTSLGTAYRALAVLASEHRFNTSPMETWRTAFREVAKLAHGSLKAAPDHMVAYLLSSWCTKNSGVPFGEWCVLGAKQGRVFGEASKENPSAMERLNDYAWLEQMFNRAARGVPSSVKGRP
jgi:hypothetical protein